MVNPELFIRQPEKYLRFTVDNKTIVVDGIVFDESALLRNPASQIFRAMKTCSEHLRYLYILSGKPAPNRLIEYYSQMQLVLPDVLFHPYDQVREALQKEAGYYTGSSVLTAKKGIPGPFTRKSFLHLIDYGSITVSKEECIDLPEKTYKTRLVELNKVGKEKYASMKHFLRVSIDEEDKQNPGLNRSIRANGILAKLSKLRQIASGFLIDGEQVLQIHPCKLKELMLVLDELGDNQVIIWCQFLHEITSISKELQKAGKHFATAFSGTKSKDESINSFKSGQVQYLIAHPKTLRYGVTLINCTYAIYYSLSYSYEEYYQSHDRIYRQGQTKPCTYLFLHVKDTIDEIMYDAIQEKKSNVEIAENLLKHLHSEMVSA